LNKGILELLSYQPSPVKVAVAVMKRFPVDPDPVWHKKLFEPRVTDFYSSWPWKNFTVQVIIKHAGKCH